MTSFLDQLQQGCLSHVGSNFDHHHRCGGQQHWEGAWCIDAAVKTWIYCDILQSRNGSRWGMDCRAAAAACLVNTWDLHAPCACDPTIRQTFASSLYMLVPQLEAGTQPFKCCAGPATT